MALRILFVERERETADLLVPCLERKGYEVIVTRSLRQTLARSGSLRPSLLILDMASFGNNGFKLRDTLRARLPGVPTILLAENKHAALVSGSEAFMAKPYTTRGLLYRVKKVAANLVDRELRAGPLVLDPDTRILRNGSQVFHLRPKEGTLLAHFMRNQGRVLTRLELMQRVWETDYVGDTRTLTVHVRWLREKIEDTPRHPRFLRTVRGVGYRFQVPPEDEAGP